MGLIDIASSKSVWRGMEYYKQNKVLSYTMNDDGTCEGVVVGSGDVNYFVHVDMEHPRKTEYARLRKFLLKDGYIRIGPEVFMRVVQNRKASEKHYRRIDESQT